MKFSRLLPVMLLILLVAFLIGAFPGVADAQLRRQSVTVVNGGATVIQQNRAFLPLRRQNVTVVGGGVQVQQIRQVNRIVAQRQNVLLLQAPNYNNVQVQQVRIQRLARPVVQQVQVYNQPQVQLQQVQQVRQYVQPVQLQQVQQVQQVQQYVQPVQLQQLQVQQYAVQPMRLLVTDNCQ